MRLLHTKELRFQEFFDADVPEYAILSHRWGPEEVSYQEFLMGAKEGAGYRKILAACAYAANDVRMLDVNDDEAGTIAAHSQISHLRLRHFEYVLHLGMSPAENLPPTNLDLAMVLVELKWGADN